MNALMLNAHHDYPERVFPRYGHGQRHFINQFEDDFLRFIPVFAHFCNRRPVVVLFVQVVPAHLVHANGKDGLKAGIDARIDYFGQHQFIDVKHSRVAEVEQDYMPQRIAAVIENIIRLQLCVQFFVNFPGFQEIIPNFYSFFFSGSLLQVKGGCNVFLHMDDICNSVLQITRGGDFQSM